MFKPKLIKTIFALWFSLLLLASSTLLITTPKNASSHYSCPNTNPKSDADQLSCWQDLIQKSLKEKGLTKTFETLSDLYSKEPLFAKNCHEFTHIIGQNAYDIFKKTQDIDLPTQTSFCGYGFYHGFMEELLAKGGNILEARKFCEFTENKLSGKIRNSGLACFHGIGHGNVDIHDESKWGNEQALIDPALRLCDKISATDDELFRCTSGVFNSISIYESGNQYGLSINKKDPIGICEKQDERYRLGCYSDMMVVLMSMTKNDFAKSAKFVEALKNDAYASRSIATLSSMNAREKIASEASYPIAISDCKNLQTRLQNDCIVGFADGLIEFGEPNKEYVKAIDYCNMLPLGDKQSCFNRVLTYGKSIYDNKKLSSICRQIYGENYNCVY